MNSNSEPLRNLELHSAEYYKKLVEEHMALTEAGQTLFSPESLGNIETIYRTLYEHIGRIMPVEVFFVARYNQSTDTFSIDYGAGNDISEQHYHAVLSRWFRNVLLEENSSRLFSTHEEFIAALKLVNRDERVEAVETSLCKHPYQSCLFVPLQYREEKIGVLCVQCIHPNSYNERYVHLLETLGIQVSLALINARTYSEMQTALRQAQESERLKNYFLMTTSHELRTPLTAIQGYLDLIHNFNAELDTAVKQRFIAKAQRACEELVLMLGNVMDTSRVDQEGITLKYSAVVVLRAVSLILEIMEPTIVREKRQIEVTIDKDITIWGDDLRLRQVLLNLVSNALKYTPSATKIAIGAERMSKEALLTRISTASAVQKAALNERLVVISVHDWGRGIAPDDQSRLFARFMRLPDAVQSGQRGSGLGLYLCRQLTEAMGGFIWVESSGIAGKGSTFLIALPEYIQQKFWCEP